MKFLPIVERELRVAARKSSTIWLRVLAGLLALVIAAGFLVLSQVFGISSSRFGPGLFGTLTWLALAATIAAGLFLTADALSEEKREGTLGFLFLTDLRGYDVVGGKLLATSLRGSFALLALFPILAVTLVMGGVTGLQFCKSALALLNALFCSLAAGLFISALSRDSQRAMGGTFVLLLLIGAGGPVLDGLLATWRRLGFVPYASLLSPVYVFWASSAWGRTAFWPGLLASHLLGWSWLWLACWIAPRTWQQAAGRVSGTSSRWTYAWRYGRMSARAARRRKWMEPNPVMWLAARERWQAVAIWVVVLVLLSAFAALAAFLPAMTWIVWGQIGWLVVIVLYLSAASQACRFNVEAKRSGLLELLLVTPLDGPAVIAGQWQAVLRLFGLPALLLVLTELAGSFLAQHSTFGMMAASGSFPAPSRVFNVLAATLGGLGILANLAALIWVGMWMGLTSKNGSMATLKTVIFVQVLPWLVINFAATTFAGLLLFGRALRGGSAANTFVLSFPLVLGGVAALLTLGKDAAFIVWARARLHTRFRAEAARLPGGPGMLGSRASTAVVLPPAIPAQP